MLQGLSPQVNKNKAEYIKEVSLLATETYRKSDAGKDATKSLKGLNTEAQDQAKLLAELSGLSGSFAEDWARLNTIFGKGKITLDQLTAAQAELLAQQPAFKKEQKDQEDTAKKLIEKWAEEKKIVDELYDSRYKLFEADEKNIQSAQAMVEQAKFELSLMGLSNVEREKAIALRQLEATGIEKTSDAYADLAATLKRVVGEQAVQNSLKQATEQLGQSLTDELMRGGKNGADYIKDLFRTVVLRPLLSPIGNALGTAIGSLPGGAAAGSGMLGSIAGSGFGQVLMGGTSAFGSGISAGFGALFGEAGLSGALSAGTTAIGAGNIMGGLGTLAGAAGPFALGALALSKLFDSKGGPKTEGGADLAGGVQAEYAALAQRLGITNNARFEAFYSKDPQGDSLTQLRLAAFSRGQNVYERLGLENVGRSDAEFTAAVGEATTRALIAALKDSDLPEQYKAYLNTLADNADVTELQKALTLIEQRKALDEEYLTATSTDAENLARARAKELAAMDPTLRAIKERIYAEQELRKAQEEQRKAQEEQRNMLRDTLTTARDALLAGYDREQAALQGVIDKHQGYADSLKLFSQQLATGPLALLSPEARYRATQSEFMRLSALDPGNEERLQKLEGAGTAFLEASQQYNASSMAYFTDLAQVRAATALSEQSARATVDVNRAILDANKGVLQQLGLLNETTAQGFAALVAAYQAAKGNAAAGGVVNLDSSLTNGVTTAGGSYIQPAQLETIMAEAQANSTVAQLYQSLLGRAPESAAVYDYYNNFTPAEIEAMIRGSSEYINGSHATGLWSVPFDGYRAELHQGERVLTATQARSSDDTAAEVKALRQEVARLTSVMSDGLRQSIGVQGDIAKNTAASSSAALLASVQGVAA